MILVAGLSHKNTPIEVREKLAIARAAIPELLAELTSHGAVGEAVVLSTCNRVEIYAAAKRRGASDIELVEASRAVTAILERIGGAAVSPHLRCEVGRPAVLHLFRVAASLDSLVVGEPQILGQLKDAIELAREHKALGTTLGNAMHRAIRVGKRVRTETGIGDGKVSVSSVAIDLARDIFGDLAGHTAVLLGAGEMAEAASKLLVRAGARLVIVNRSLDRAEALAAEVGGTPRPWSELDRALVEADIVISSTSSPGYVVTQELVKSVRKARKGRSLFLIDIAVPRDIDPEVNKLDNIFLYDVDNLSQIVHDSREGRATEARRAESITSDEARGFEAWTREQALTPTIVGLRARTRAVLEAELARSLAGRLRHLPAADREALAIMLDAATNKLLHEPVTRLRALAGDPRAEDYIATLQALFDVALENGQSPLEVSDRPSLPSSPNEEESAPSDSPLTQPSPRVPHPPPPSPASGRGGGEPSKEALRAPLPRAGEGLG